MRLVHDLRGAADEALVEHVLRLHLPGHLVVRRELSVHVDLDLTGAPLRDVGRRVVGDRTVVPAIRTELVLNAVLKALALHLHAGEHQAVAGEVRRVADVRLRGAQVVEIRLRVHRVRFDAEPADERPAVLRGHLVQRRQSEHRAARTGEIEERRRSTALVQVRMANQRQQLRIILRNLDQRLQLLHVARVVA